MKSLFNILKQKKEQSPALRKAILALTIEEADKILGELFGKEIIFHARAAYVKNKNLAIRCRGSAAAQEIKLNESKILAVINQKFGPDTVRRITYTA